MNSRRTLGKGVTHQYDTVMATQKSVEIGNSYYGHMEYQFAMTTYVTASELK